MHIGPQRLSGPWDEGYSLDRHIRVSEFAGYNEYGHPQFETTRTDLGELLFQLKYRGDQSAVPPIAEVAARFVRDRNLHIDVIVPAPPSKHRATQPLFEIADHLGRLLGVSVDRTSVQKIRATPELKNLDHDKRIEAVAGIHAVDRDALQGRRVLLLDDLYQSGATLSALSSILKEQGGASAVIALALTRARG